MLSFTQRTSTEKFVEVQRHATHIYLNTHTKNLYPQSPHHPTYRNYSEDGINHTRSNGGVDWLLDTCILEDSCWVIEHLDRNRRCVTDLTVPISYIDLSKGRRTGVLPGVCSSIFPSASSCTPNSSPFQLPLSVQCLLQLLTYSSFSSATQVSLELG